MTVHAYNHSNIITMTIIILTATKIGELLWCSYNNMATLVGYTTFLPSNQILAIFQICSQHFACKQRKTTHNNSQSFKFINGVEAKIVTYKSVNFDGKICYFYILNTLRAIYVCFVCYFRFEFAHYLTGLSSMMLI